jgi:glutaredoxin-like YruB-family protein
MKKSVTVYSTSTCPYCVKVKNYLKEKGVEYRDIDVGQDRAAAMEMIEKSGQMGVPVIDVGGEIVVGFQPKVLDQLLAQ